MDAQFASLFCRILKMIKEPKHPYCRGNLRKLVMKTLADPGYGGCATRNDNVAPHGLADVDIACGYAGLD